MNITAEHLALCALPALRRLARSLNVRGWQHRCRSVLARRVLWALEEERGA